VAKFVRRLFFKPCRKMSMTHTTRILLLLLAASAAIAGYFHLRGEHGERPSSQSATQIIMSQWPAIHAAEQIEDAAARCLAYPDMPGLSWKHELLEATCRWQSFRFMTAKDVKDALDNGHPEAVDETFRSYLDQHYTDPSKHGLIHRAYGALFANSTAETRALVERWTTLAPNSAFALAARGTYELQAGWDARGSDYAPQTPQANMDTMQALMQRAQVDFLDALRINPRLGWAHGELINLSKARGDRALLDRSVEAGLKLDPADERIYIEWMTASEPRWGGSLLAMQTVASRASTHIRENPYLALLAEKPQSYEAIRAWQRHDPMAALELFDKALATAPSGQDFQNAGDVAYQAAQLQRAVLYYSQAYRFGSASESVSWRAKALVDMGRPELAAQSLQEKTIASARSTADMVGVATGLHSLHRDSEAETLLVRILDHNPRDRDALDLLARLYLDSNPRQMDKAQAIIAKLTMYYPNYARGWLLSGVGKPDKECHEALRKYLELVDPQDPQERDNLIRAKKRLAELERDKP
jgi:tetratricopeptide (TPR) repeat protein